MSAGLTGAERAGRDFGVDLLRVASVLVIVFEHWFTAKVHWDDHRLASDSIVADARWAAPLTWLSMTVPMLFFAGGYANAVLLRRSRPAPGLRAGGGLRTSSGLRAFWGLRIRRLVVPFAVFVAVWLGVEAVLHALDVGGAGLVRGVGLQGVLPFGPLWFLGIYLGLIVVAPAMLALHDRFGGSVVAVLAGAAIAVDALRFLADVSLVGWLNLAFVWLLPHQFGLWYADGPSRLRRRRTGLALAGVGFAALLALTMSGAYPASIGGVTGDPISNMRPPTLVLVALTLWQLGLVILAEPLLRSLGRRPRWVARVGALNRATMSIYLWHMPALALVAVVCRPFGLANRADSYQEWWWQRPIWFGLGAAFLAGMVALVGWAERIGRIPVRSGPPPAREPAEAGPRGLSSRPADRVRSQVGAQNERNSGGECGADALRSSRQR